MKHTRAQLRATEGAYRRAIRAIENGLPIGDTLEMIAAASTRVDLNRVLSELEHSRHRSRLSMFAGGIDEGLSISDLGRSMGFSRQLAARYTHEIGPVG